MTFEQRKAAAEAILRAGYDPERENGAPARTDAWCAALGWQDALLDEALRYMEAV